MTVEGVNFCLQCGTSLVVERRFGKPRPVCPACDWIYFPDPKVAAAILVEKEGEVLLVRRAVDPERGRWSLPAGYIDAGEDPVEAAIRECLEETGLHVEIIGLVEVFAGQDHPRGAHIILLYRGEIVDGNMEPGDDVDDAAFFSRGRLPPLAFSTTLKMLFFRK